MKKEEITQVCGAFVKETNKTLQQIHERSKELLTEILTKHYDDFHWDFNEEDTPSIMSYCFGDEPTDCFITRLYCAKDNVIRMDLYAYYSGEKKIAVSVESEPEICYTDLLEYVMSKIG